MDLLLVVVGIAAAGLGAAGVLGMMDRTRFSLYQRHSTRDLAPEEHRRLQRVGGGFLLVAGVTMVIVGLVF